MKCHSKSFVCVILLIEWHQYEQLSLMLTEHPLATQVLSSSAHFFACAKIQDSAV